MNNALPLASAINPPSGLAPLFPWAKIVALAGGKTLPLTGTLNGAARVTGTVGDPHATADLTLATFPHHEADRRASTGAAHGTHGDGPRRAVVEVHPPPQARQVTFRGRPVDLREVLLLDPERRMRQSVRELAVVREDQQTLGVGVDR